MRPGTGWGVAAVKPAQPPGRLPLSLLLLAVWFGLVAGLLELALLVVRVHGFEKGFFLRSRHFIWMVPASDVMILGTWGLLLALASRRGSRLPQQVVIASFLFLACMSLLLLVRGLHAVTCVLMSVGIAYRTARSIARDDRLPRLWRLIRVTSPVLIVILAAVVATAIARDSARRSPIAEPIAAGAKFGAERPVDRPGHRPRRSPQPARLRPRHDPEPDAPGEPRSPLPASAASAPWTLPSHASLFTGRWPHDLLVERLGWLDGTHTTLAEFLGRRGYLPGDSSPTSSSAATNQACRGVSRRIAITRSRPAMLPARPVSAGSWLGT